MGGAGRVRLVAAGVAGLAALQVGLLAAFVALLVRQPRPLRSRAGTPA